MYCGVVRGLQVCARPQLLMDLRSTDTEWETPIRDILGGRDWSGLRGKVLLMQEYCFHFMTFSFLLINLEQPL
jgi:hypothetical protein